MGLNVDGLLVYFPYDYIYPEQERNKKRMLTYFLFKKLINHNFIKKFPMKLTKSHLKLFMEKMTIV